MWCSFALCWTKGREVLADRVLEGLKRRFEVLPLCFAGQRCAFEGREQQRLELPGKVGSAMPRTSPSVGCRGLVRGQFLDLKAFSSTKRVVRQALAAWLFWGVVAGR